MTAPKGNEDHTARIIAGVPEGLDALVLAQLVNEAGSQQHSSCSSGKTGRCAKGEAPLGVLYRGDPVAPAPA